jgi:hypothetical protein
MIRIVAIAVFFSLVACASGTGPQASAQTVKSKGGWQGDPCHRDSDCNTLWCVNARCEIREP